MQESQQMPRRIVQAEEIARYETCPLAWWYDHKHRFAGASSAEIQQRMDIFEIIRGPDARDHAEYHVMERFLQHASDGQPPTVKPAPILPAGPPQALLGCIGVTALAIVGLVLLGIMMLAAHP